jgi:hypothetical protein
LGDAIENVSNDKAIEGGSTADEGGSSIEIDGPHPVEKHRRVVTISLIALLAVIVVGHYVCLAILEWHGKKTDSVASAFNSALPVVSGLVGSAVTYYFTRGR